MVTDLLPTTETIGKRYVLMSQLGAGGMGMVYRAADRLTGQTVALKRVANPAEQHPSISQSDSMNLRLSLAQEFKMLSSLRHPNIISVLDYGFEDQRQPFFTMELVESAQTILEAGEDQTRTLQVGLLVQMLQALVYLHRRGIVHRDLKPSNVLVADGQVKVLDFGVSIGQEHHDAIGGTTAGTLAYMAPEVLMGKPVTETADLYSVGIMAYELFVGHHPFDTENISNLLHDILTRLPDVSIIADAQLAAILARLLTKEPADRYEDARAVITALCETVNIPVPEESAAIRESFLQAAQLVERDTEIARLAGVLTQALEGKGAIWLVAGESGVGKSRLLEEMRALAMVQGALVLRGQSVSEGGKLYGLWRDILRWLCLLTYVDDTEAGVLKMLVPDIDDLLGRAIADAPPADNPQAARDRLFEVVESVFRRHKTPLVLILEDLQWTGESLDLLAYLIPLVEDLPLLILASYRDDERPEIPEKLPGANVLKLERLTQLGIAQLSSAMLGSAGRQSDVLDLLQRETEGNVFFLVEVVRALAEEAGQLARIGTTTLPAQVFAGGIQRIVERRLSRLSPGSRPLLQIAAVAGRQLDLPVLQAAAPGIVMEEWLTECANAAVLDVQENQWRFAHDKLREGVLIGLPENERWILHQRVAQAIEIAYPDAPEQVAMLAFHWGAAGNHDRQALYAALAGDQAMRNGINYAAMHYYEQSLAAMQKLAKTDESRQQFIEITLKLARVGAFFSNENILTLLQQAMADADALADEVLQARVLGSTGAAYYMGGQTGQALGYFGKSMALAEKLNIEELLLLPYNIIARALTITGDYPKATPMLAKGIALAEKFNDLELLAGSLAFYGTAFWFQGQRAEGNLHAERARQLAEQMGHPSRITGNLAVFGATNTFCGFHDDATADLMRCVTMSKETKDIHPLYTAYGALGYMALLKGDLNQAREYLDECLGLAEYYKTFFYLPMYQAYRAELDLLVEDWQAALSRTEAALQLAERTQQLTAAAEVLLALGKIHSQKPEPDWDKAEDYVKRAIASHQQGNRLPFVANGIYELGKLYRACGMTEQARTTFDEAAAMFQRLEMKWHLERLRAMQAANI
jgi:predicted ATPase